MPHTYNVFAEMAFSMTHLKSDNPHLNEAIQFFTRTTPTPECAKAHKFKIHEHEEQKYTKTKTIADRIFCSQAKAIPINHHIMSDYSVKVTLSQCKLRRIIKYVKKKLHELFACVLSLSKYCVCVKANDLPHLSTT